MMQRRRYALEAIRHLDFLYLHIEAPDEAGHLGSIEEKVTAIERVDDVIGMILEEFDGVLAVLPDHPTPIRVKTHTRDPVPFVVAGKRKGCNRNTTRNRQPGPGGSGRKMRWISWISYFHEIVRHQTPASSSISVGVTFIICRTCLVLFLYLEIYFCPSDTIEQKTYLLFRK